MPGRGLNQKTVAQCGVFVTSSGETARCCPCTTTPMPLWSTILSPHHGNFDEFTVLFEAGDEEQNKVPRAIHLNRRDLDCHPNLTHPFFLYLPSRRIFYFFITACGVILRFLSYSISRGGANIMHPELVDSERVARGDGIAIKSGVKILESRLDMTKRARKTLNYEKVEMSKWRHSRHQPHLEVTFIFFHRSCFFGSPERTR